MREWCTRAGLYLAVLLAPAAAHALDIHIDGYADLRLIAPDSETSWLKGGLGKLRYGAEADNVVFASGGGQASIQLAPEWLGVAVARIAPEQREFADLLEGYVRYRPVSTSRLRWSVKAGAFFPPVSFENTEIGWSSYWTVTPSAINTWIGAELRTIGGEAKLEWRGTRGTLSFVGAVFGWNDPAGVLMADRGWALDDLPMGLFDHPREPDATILSFGDTPPDRTLLFKEIDNRPGWYAGVMWDDANLWQLHVLRYDNRGDPTAHAGEYFAWNTSFWSAGFSKRFEAFTLLAQGMTGSTEIAPSARFTSITDFDSAFLLAGWEKGRWRLAGRGEIFETVNRNSFGPGGFGENGYAFTAAASFLPNGWLRLTGEVLYLWSERNERRITGLNPVQPETQFQLSARIYL